MDGILQHFRKEEQPFIELVQDWMREVEDNYSPKLTGFLDPRERFIVNSIVKSFGLLTSECGAFAQAERQRILIFPDYYIPTAEDFQISVFCIQYASKFITLEHPTVLGSLMAMGLDRSKFGDIMLKNDEVQFAITEELSSYVEVNFTSAGKAKIHLEKLKDNADWLENNEQWVEVTQILSSLRLDTVVAALLTCSRQKASAFIHGEKVKVNWRVVDQPAFELNESDLISIRGHGRFKVFAIEGRTRKNKIRLITGKLE